MEVFFLDKARVARQEEQGEFCSRLESYRKEEGPPLV